MEKYCGGRGRALKLPKTSVDVVMINEVRFSAEKEKFQIKFQLSIMVDVVWYTMQRFQLNGFNWSE